ncbi:MAG: sortase [Rubrobacter sp.]
MSGRCGSGREGTVARFTEKIMNVMSLLLVGVGIAIAATFFAGSPPPDAEAASAERTEPRVESRVESKVKPGVEPRAGQPEVPVDAEKVEREIKEQADRRVLKRVRVPRGPERKMLRVTIPGMRQVQDSKIPYAASDDEKAFRKYAGVHLRGTGNPWDKEANVYIAGHRLGYPTTDSFLAFWDLNVLERDDKVFVTDADGKRYVYRVFRIFIVDPNEVSVLRPLEGRNVLTLQTCTLPDYSRRLIVQAEKVVKG